MLTPLVSLEINLQDVQKAPPARPQRVKARGVPSGYVEGLNDARTTPEDFFNILLRIMGGISYEGKPPVETWTSPISFPCRLQDSYGTVTQEPV